MDFSSFRNDFSSDESLSEIKVFRNSFLELSAFSILACSSRTVDMNEKKKSQPLIQTNDSILIDNSLITIDEQFELALKQVYKKLKK
jgi:hypothetical protein